MSPFLDFMRKNGLKLEKTYFLYYDQEVPGSHPGLGGDEIRSVLAFTAFGGESSMPDKKGPEGEGGWGGGGGGAVASTSPRTEQVILLHRRRGRDANPGPLGLRLGKKYRPLYRLRYPIGTSYTLSTYASHT